VHYAQDKKAIIPVINIMQQVQKMFFVMFMSLLGVLFPLKIGIFSIIHTRIEFIISFYFVMHVIVRT
jgi:hypothetical protein